MIKIALPKGEIQEPVKNFLAARGLDVSGYRRDARAYSSGAGDIFSKQFRERDIPIQVSIGNYALGLCASNWVAEHLAQYPKAEIMNLRTLNIPAGFMCICCSAKETEGTTGKILSRMALRGPVRIATQFPGLAEEFALRRRLPDFRIFHLWGAAEAYPPEGSELALLCVSDERFITGNGLRMMERLFSCEVSLIANSSLFEKDELAPVLNKLV